MRISGKVASRAALVLSLVLLGLSPVVAAAPFSPKFAASFSYNPFFSTTPTFTDVASIGKVTPVPWAVELANYIAYNDTGTKSTNVAFCAAQDIDQECLTLDFYNTHTGLAHTGDLAYTGPDGTSLLVGHFNFTTGADVTVPSGLWLTQDSSGNVALYDGNHTYVNSFLATPFTIGYIALSGNVNSGSGNNYEATGGYISVWIAGDTGIQGMTNLIIELVPLIVIVAVIGMVVGMLKSFKF